MPIRLNRRKGNFAGMKTYTVGANADSYYEYLLKMWLLKQQKVLLVSIWAKRCSCPDASGLSGSIHSAGVVVSGSTLLCPKLQLRYLPYAVLLALHHHCWSLLCVQGCGICQGPYALPLMCSACVRQLFDLE